MSTTPSHTGLYSILHARAHNDIIIAADDDVIMSCPGPHCTPFIYSPAGSIEHLQMVELLQMTSPNALQAMLMLLHPANMRPTPWPKVVHLTTFFTFSTTGSDIQATRMIHDVEGWCSKIGMIVRPGLRVIRMVVFALCTCTTAGTHLEVLIGYLYGKLLGPTVCVLHHTAAQRNHTLQQREFNEFREFCNIHVAQDEMTKYTTTPNHTIGSQCDWKVHVWSWLVSDVSHKQLYASLIPRPSFCHLQYCK